MPARPQLAQAGAFDSSDIYTVADVAHITAFANARGIDVVVEVDVPGHTTSVAESYPQHVACREAEPWMSYANEPPAGQLRCVYERDGADRAGSARTPREPSSRLCSTTCCRV